MASGDQRTRIMGHFCGAFTSLKAPEAIHYICMDYKTIHIHQSNYIHFCFCVPQNNNNNKQKNVWKNIVVSKQWQFHFKNSLRVLIKKVEKNNRKQQKHIRRTFMALLKIKAIYYVSQKAKRLKKTQRKTALLIKMPQGTVFPIFEAFFFFAWECIVIFDK